MSGSMYDVSVTTFSPEGRIYQVEYATKAVEVSETVVGIKCKDGVILAGEKQIFSKLLTENTNRRIYNLDNSIGLAICGKVPDGRNILNRARQEAAEYMKSFAVPISGTILSERIALYMHQYTIYGSYRPFGVAGIERLIKQYYKAFISSYDQVDGINLHMIEPSGHVYSYHAYAHGKGRQVCKSEIARRDFKTMTCRDALQYVAKMLILSHEEFKEKKFEYEMTWICQESGLVHKTIPNDLRDEAVRLAEAQIKQDSQAPVV